jgi:hypothetical protein
MFLTPWIEFSIDQTPIYRLGRQLAQVEGTAPSEFMWPHKSQSNATLNSETLVFVCVATPLGMKNKVVKKNFQITFGGPSRTRICNAFRPLGS